MSQYFAAATITCANDGFRCLLYHTMVCGETKQSSLPLHSLQIPSACLASAETIRWPFRYPLPNYFPRSGVPAEDTKDMYQSSDGYLYASGAFQSHTITTFKVAGHGALTENAGSPYHVPGSVGKTKLEHAYIGLTGFDK